MRCYSSADPVAREEMVCISVSSCVCFSCEILDADSLPAVVVVVAAVATEWLADIVKVKVHSDTVSSKVITLWWERNVNDVVVVVVVSLLLVGEVGTHRYKVEHFLARRNILAGCLS